MITPECSQATIRAWVQFTSSRVLGCDLESAEKSILHAQIVHCMVLHCGFHNVYAIDCDTIYTSSLPITCRLIDCNSSVSSSISKRVASTHQSGSSRSRPTMFCQKGM